jgi:hypothetical protein
MADAESHGEDAGSVSDATVDVEVDATQPIDANQPPDVGEPMDSTPLCPGACDADDIVAPRPIAPLSTSRVTSHRPVFRWVLEGNDDGAAVDICIDRACTDVVETFSAKGSSGAATADLVPGVYFWRLRGMEGSLRGTTTSAVWELTVPPRSATVNTSWGTTLDVNGDGLADVVAGGTMRDIQGGGTGTGQVYLGGAAGLSTSPASTLSGTGGSVGTLVASAGDVNGDGFGDLIVGEPGASQGSFGNIGQFAIYFGSAAGLTMPPEIVIAPNTMTFEFGNAPASAGDVNGDGYGDVMVSGVGETDNASIYIFYGGPKGLPATAAVVLTAGIEVGYSNATDINGDGFSDVVVGLNGNPFSGSSGSVDIYYGSATGLSADPVVLDYTGTMSTGFELGVGPAGDVNGDGFGDVLVWLPDVGKGVVDLYLGGAKGLSATPLTVPNPVGKGLNAVGPVAVGDVNADGFDDAVFAASGQYGVSEAGAAYVFLGSVLGLAPTAVLTGPATAVGNFGGVVAGAGDINGDGFDDALVGATAYPGAGTVYVYPGGAQGLTSPSASFEIMFESLQ